MKFIEKLLLFIFLISAAALFSEEGNGPLVSEIVSGIDSYNNTNVTAVYRLKYVDKIFEKIIFYDSENSDIEFDISDRKKKAALAEDMLNIHEGMLYRIRFRVSGVGSMGGVIGELLEFKPVIIEKIPEGNP